MDTDTEELKRCIFGLPDEELLEIVCERREEYRQESFNLACRELVRRGVAIDGHVKEKSLAAPNMPPEFFSRRRRAQLRHSRWVKAATIGVFLTCAWVVEHFLKRVWPDVPADSRMLFRGVICGLLIILWFLLEAAEDFILRWQRRSERRRKSANITTAHHA